MLDKNAAQRIVEMLQEIQSRLDAISDICQGHAGEDDRESYAATVEFVTGYLHQDVMHPVLVDYPELAPDNWKRDGRGQWIRKAGN
jgi:hypothetical protein